MKIIKLVAENVKRLHAVEVTPGDAPLITIGGKNGAGKSSVLDSIAYAMGGEKLVPSEPIRAGETEARVVVDLGDLVVTRKFKRDKNYVQCNGPEVGGGNVGVIVGHEHNEGCQWQWGETRSTLVVTNKDGARYPSPQAMLDKLLGRLTFDPLAFARDDPKRQDETLRKLVGLDVAPIDARRAAAASERASLKKIHAIKESQLLALPKYPEAPEAEIPMGEITKAMQDAEDARVEAEKLEQLRSADETTCERISGDLKKIDALIADTEARLAQLRRDREATAAHAAEAGNRLEAAAARAEAARAGVPDAAALRARLREAETTNAQVRANQRYKTALEEIAALASQVEEQDALVAAADAEKRAALATTKFPVEGLGLSDNGVMFNGLPFAQAGSAEQLRVSVMVGLALNPKLKVLLIRNGNMLDEDSLKYVGELATDAGAQVWIEWVTGDASDVAVMLVDGEVTH